MNLHIERDEKTGRLCLTHGRDPNGAAAVGGWALDLDDEDEAKLRAFLAEEDRKKEQ